MGDLLTRSTTVVQGAVNSKVIGSNPIESVLWGQSERMTCREIPIVAHEMSVMASPPTLDFTAPMKER